MTQIQEIKNNLIDRILATRNEKLLIAIETIFSSTNDEQIVDLTSEQIEMLSMSHNDIKNGNVISQAELDKNDFEWLK